MGVVLYLLPSKTSCWMQYERELWILSRLCFRSTAALLRKPSTTLGTTSALHWASVNGYLEVVRLMLTLAGANKDGDNPLHFACGNGHLEIETAGANVEAASNGSWTSLHTLPRTSVT
jgi:ankyrin repeat protein